MNRPGLLAVASLLAALGSVVGWQTEPPERATGEPMLDGSTLFRTKGCAACHTGPESRAPFGSGSPPLTDAPAWAGDRRPDLTAEQYLSQSIREPWAFISPARSGGGGGPGNAMPGLGLSEEEVSAVVDYLLSG